MVVKRPCSFCGSDIEPGTGKMFVRRDGTIYYFCKLKCQKNLLELGRMPRRVRWTDVYYRAKRGVAVETKEEVVVPPHTAVGIEEVEVEEEFSILAPKGKDIPQATIDLIDRRFGPELSLASIEKNFKEFTASESLKHSIALWYKKRYPGKKLTEITSAEYVAFLDTAQSKKLLKDWLDEKAKKEGK